MSVVLALVLVELVVADPLVIGHRGAAGLAPENTMAAVEAAILAGVDGVEVDVHRSSDGELVVIHDTRLSRTSDGNGKVGSQTLEELKALDVGSWFSPEFKDERIPTLSELLVRIEPTDLLIFIELKKPRLYPGIEQQLVELIEENGLEDRVQILSFDKRALARSHDLSPDIVTSGLWRVVTPVSRRRELSVVNSWFRPWLTSPNAIKSIHEQGRSAMAWGVVNLDDMLSLTELGIDAVTTDYPDLLCSPLVADTD